MSPRPCSARTRSRRPASVSPCHSRPGRGARDAAMSGCRLRHSYSAHPASNSPPRRWAKLRFQCACAKSGRRAIAAWQACLASASRPSPASSQPRLACASAIAGARGDGAAHVAARRVPPIEVGERVAEVEVGAGMGRGQGDRLLQRGHGGGRLAERVAGGAAQEPGLGRARLVHGGAGRGLARRLRPPAGEQRTGVGDQRLDVTRREPGGDAEPFAGCDRVPPREQGEAAVASGRAVSGVAGRDFRVEPDRRVQPSGPVVGEALEQRVDRVLRCGHAAQCCRRD